MTHDEFIDAVTQGITARERAKKIDAEHAQAARRIARSGEQRFDGQPVEDAVENCLMLARLRLKR